MATKPILMNTEMVRAILDGRKTCTRRVVKSGSYTPMEMACPKFYGFRDELNGKPGAWAGFYGDRHVFIGQDGKQHIDAIYAKLPYCPGDILYVRETWATDADGEYVYRTNYGATEDDSFPPSMFKWHPSIHMPKEAARIFLRVTDVRVERLQDCGNMQAKDEGCTCCAQFIRIWDSTIKYPYHPRYGWEANPWVWVIEFERIGKEAALGGESDGKN